jgi:hypothetical protein
VVFLILVWGLVPAVVFDFVAVGWVLFVADCALTLVKPRVAYALAFVLALLALSSSLPQGAHYAFIEEGLVLPSAIFILGTVAQVLLLVLVPSYFLRQRRRPRAGAEAKAG